MPYSTLLCCQPSLRPVAPYGKNHGFYRTFGGKRAKPSRNRSRTKKQIPECNPYNKPVIFTCPRSDSGVSSKNEVSGRFYLGRAKVWHLGMDFPVPSWLSSPPLLILPSRGKDPPPRVFRFLHRPRQFGGGAGFGGVAVWLHIFFIWRFFYA